MSAAVASGGKVTGLGGRVREVSRASGRCTGRGAVGSELDAIAALDVLNVRDTLLDQAVHHLLSVVSADAEVVLDLLHGLRAVGVADQHTSAGGVGAPALAAADVPGVADHQLEVVIVVDATGAVAVVLDELSSGHAAILVDGIEGVQELSEDVVLGAAAGQHVGVLVSVVLGGDVVQLDHTTVVRVKDLESHQHQLSAAVVQLAADAEDELVEIDGAGAVAVEVVEDDAHLLGGPVEGMLGDHLHELLEVDLATVVVIGNAELSADASNAAGTVGVQGLLENVHERIGVLHDRGNHSRRGNNRLRDGLDFDLAVLEGEHGSSSLGPGGGVGTEEGLGLEQRLTHHESRNNRDIRGEGELGQGTLQSRSQSAIGDDGSHNDSVHLRGQLLGGEHQGGQLGGRGHHAARNALSDESLGNGGGDSIGGKVTTNDNTDLADDGRLLNSSDRGRRSRGSHLGGGSRGRRSIIPRVHATAGAKRSRLLGWTTQLRT